MCDIDHDSCDVWRETDRTARKEHVCRCCGGAIEPGQRYTVISIVVDGRAYSEKECAACRAMAKRFAESHGSRFSPSQMRYALDECIDEEGEDSEEGKLWRAEMDQMLARWNARKGRAA